MPLSPLLRSTARKGKISNFSRESYDESWEEFAIFVGIILIAMKRLLFLLLFVLAAVSCGSQQKDLQRALSQMLDSYENDDDPGFIEAFEDFGAAVNGMDNTGSEAILEVFVAFRDSAKEKYEWNDDQFYGHAQCMFNYRPERHLQPFEPEAVVLFATQLYEAADEVYWHHAPVMDAAPYYEMRQFAAQIIPYRSECLEVQESLLDRWDQKRESIQQQRQAAWAEADRKWNGKRIITKDAVGPIRIGSSVKDLPESMEGFYDYIVKTPKSMAYAETDIAWQETHYLAFYKGQLVFDLMTTVQDMDMFDDYDQPADTDFDEIVQFEVYSPDYQTSSGLGINSKDSDLFAAGGVGFHYDRGEYIWDGTKTTLEQYNGVYAEGLLFKCPDTFLLWECLNEAKEKGWDAFCFSKECLAHDVFSPYCIMSVLDGWIDPYMQRMIVREQKEEKDASLDFFYD